LKSIFVFAFLCLALTNAFNSFHLSDDDLKILQTQQVTNEADDFNEISALEAFIKGFMHGSGAGNATDSIHCLTGNGPSTLFDYYYGLALAAGTSGQTSALENARTYLNTVGARQLRRLPADFAACLANSQDVKNIETAFKGANPTGDEFGALFSATAGRNSAYFHSTFSNIYAAMTAGQFEDAGWLFGAYSKIATIAKKST